MTNISWSKEQEFVRILDIHYRDRTRKNVDLIIGVNSALGRSHYL